MFYYRYPDLAPDRRIYQLAFTTPGTSPRITASRSLLRDRPNFR
jgi:hypothetical protein